MVTIRYTIPLHAGLYFLMFRTLPNYIRGIMDDIVNFIDVEYVL